MHSQTSARTAVMATLTHTSISPSSSSICRAARLQRVGLGDVGGRDAGAPPGLPDLGGGRLEPLAAARDQADIGAAAGELARAGATDAGRRSGDRDDLALEAHPQVLPEVGSGYAKIGPAPM